jgi:UDP-N-acetylmuramoylalanine--D-glutamate ligase
VNDKRIAILGAGRSGVAVARAAKKLGAEPTVYDSKPADDPKLAGFADELRWAGIPFVGGFEGPLNPGTTDILVTSPGVDSRSEILQGAKEAGIEVIGEIEFAYRISKAPIVAITGTNGKSTTTLMTYLCLKALEMEPVLCGNIYGSGFEEVPLTEAAANSREDQVLVAEISSFQLEWITSFRPKCAAITNITPDHLNRYDSFDDYAKTKLRIFENMGAGDCEIARSGDRAIGSTDGPRIIETQFDDHAIYIHGHAIPLSELPFSEPHNIQNAAMAGLLAYCIAEARGKDGGCAVNRIAQGLKGFHGLRHRMEYVGERNGIRIINNSMCTNPGAVIASSESILAPQHLLMGGITKGLDFTPVGQYLNGKPIRVYLFGADGSKIREQLKAEFPVLSTMGEAFEAAIAKARPGEVVMLSPGCASMDQFNDFRARGDEFKRIAKEWLDNDTTTTH